MRQYTTRFSGSSASRTSPGLATQGASLTSTGKPSAPGADARPQFGYCSRTAMGTSGRAIYFSMICFFTARLEYFDRHCTWASARSWPPLIAIAQKTGFRSGWREKYTVSPSEWRTKAGRTMPRADMPAWLSISASRAARLPGS